MLLFGLFYIRLMPYVSLDLWENMHYYQISATLLKISLVLLNIYFILNFMEILEEKEKSKVSHLATLLLNIQLSIVNFQRGLLIFLLLYGNFYNQGSSIITNF